MNYKKVAVYSADMRKFVESLLSVGAVGGILTDECLAVKGIMPRAEVMVPENQSVPESENIKVMETVPVKETSVFQTKIVDEDEEGESTIDKSKDYSREELEEMSLKDLKALTGVKARDKEVLINHYFEQKENNKE